MKALRKCAGAPAIPRETGAGSEFRVMHAGAFSLFVPGKLPATRNEEHSDALANTKTYDQR